MNAFYPSSIAEVSDAVRSYPRVIVRGGGTKPALIPRATDAAILDLGNLRGILEYDPSEFTFTALAGTPLREIANALAERGQYLPFDPPFADAGATIGGTVAAGLSGARRLRYGGIRDFIIGIRYVDGEGRVISGGGKVVKNAAGFDLPKLFTGSLGAYGALVELTFKVFPSPASRLHLVFERPSLEDLLALQQSIALSAWEPEALDLAPPHTLHLTLAGDAGAVRATAGRIGPPASERESGFDPVAVDGDWLAKLPLTPAHLAALDPELDRLGVRRNYSVAGNVAWLASDDAVHLPALDALLAERNLNALLLRGHAATPLLGAPLSPFARRIADVLDPAGRFLSPLRTD